MDKNAVSKRLLELASDNQNRSKAARLRDVIDDVESALAADVFRAAVLAELNAHGLDMSLSTFETTLKRIRAKRSRIFQEPAPHPARVPAPAKSTPPVSAPSSSPEPGDASHNPIDLHRILSSKPDLVALAKLAKSSRQ